MNLKIMYHISTKIVTYSVTESMNDSVEKSKSSFIKLNKNLYVYKSTPEGV